MKAQSKRKNWKGIIEDWHVSGRSQKAYCRQKGYAYSTFCYWNRRLRQDIFGASPEDRLCAVEVGRFPSAPIGISDVQRERVDMDTQGIVITLADSDATVTIAGRMSLEALGRIFAACEGATNHARP